jgi:FhaA, N-terminal domain/FHA domain
MGLTRKDGSPSKDVAGAGPKNDLPDHPRETRSDKKSQLYVRPDELARKLVKEMESSKISWSSGTSVCNVYTVYLCPQDFERLERRQDQICSRLERHLAKYVRQKGYKVVGDVVVSLAVDQDLKLGRFGLLAERSSLDGPSGSTVSAQAGAASAGSGSGSDRDGLAGTTAVIPADEAVEGGLARQTIVLRAGNRVREFNHGRVIVGRAQDADFRVDDPNVSRRHAAIYWSEGDLVVMDLDSTNGTMVNGYPVSSSVLGPDDVVTIGECRITVETR